MYQALEDALLRGEKLHIIVDYASEGTVDITVEKDGEHMFSDLAFASLDDALNMTCSVLEAAQHRVRENLADYAHKAWSGWMDYLFEKSTLNPDGTVTIPAWAVERWKRQAKTPYAELPEGEKESDRKEADFILRIMNTKDAHSQ